MFMLACEEQKQKSYASALEAVKKAFLEDALYIELLSSPALPLKERLHLLDEAFADTLPEYVLSYLKLLCEKGKLAYFFESVEEYNALLNESEHMAHARITSAVELTKDEKERLLQKLEKIENSRIHADYFVDAALLGGLIVEVNGKIMDGSLRHRLHEVKEVMNT